MPQAFPKFQVWDGRKNFHRRKSWRIRAPANALKNVKCPVLALNGEKDIQVDATMNLTAIQQRISENGNKNVTVKAYPNLNHLLQTCEKGTLAEYGQLEETISPEVLKDMTEWIQKQ